MTRSFKHSALLASAFLLAAVATAATGQSASTPANPAIPASPAGEAQRGMPHQAMGQGGMQGHGMGQGGMHGGMGQARHAGMQGGTEQGGHAGMQHGGMGGGQHKAMQHGGMGGGQHAAMQHGGMGGGQHAAMQHGGMVGGQHAAMQHGGMGDGQHAAMQHGGMGGGQPAAMQHGGMGGGQHAAMQHGGMGGMRGMSAMHDPANAADLQLVHQMLANHDRIKRTVTNLPDGIKTVTESDDQAVAQLIKAHVASMGKRREEGRLFNLFSPTLPVLFQNRDKIQTEVKTTANGVIVTQWSSEPALVSALQAHAVEVSELARDGMVAMRRNMMAGMRMMRHNPRAALDDRISAAPAHSR